MSKRVAILFSLAVFTFGAITVSAQSDDAPKKEDKIPGFKGEVIAQLKDAAGKYISLAKATPDEKLSWRPAEGIRSNTEVWMHVANANFLISKALGADVPSDLPKEMEKVTDRKQVLHYLKLSFETAGMQIMKLKEEDLGKEVDFFGQKRTSRDVLLTLAVHCQNHLGQSVAYARMNGVKPPWAR
ncbi:MAG: DinB family protein [Pyrinomonadaceae bacterium]|nr:DinB family protein [Pyrinomonadaceae bacterium]